jgi:hypothetical protein
MEATIHVSSFNSNLEQATHHDLQNRKIELSPIFFPSKIYKARVFIILSSVRWSSLPTSWEPDQDYQN